ncbi:YciI family protein [Bradyrhizobium sp. Tv2a-2]|uniref:YciI family protein n=1 Tax=Bradyrhizobium sp. Tv2a-2 TaxID=113395 RepID=UPI00041AD15C|nr:YciI family protein [Bradyrhizobium sp. Tv2a-2]
MIFVNYLKYGDRHKILELRPVHQKYLFDLRDRGLLVAAGSFAGDVGGLFLYETDTMQSAEALMANDPYILGGAIEHYSISPWEVHAVNPLLLRTTPKAAS